MAERRMFAKTIIGSDAFLEMPATSQLLYFHLSMRADDDGFINNPKGIQKMVGSCDDDLRLLIAKKFIIPFETGIVVIKHWKIHNYIQRDRYNETKYKVEKSTLMLDENSAYTMDVSKMDTECIQDVSKMDTQVRLGKVRLGKDNNKGKKEKSFTPPTLEEVKAYAEIRCRTDIAKKFFDWYDVGGWVDTKGKPIQVWKQKFIYWESTNPAPIRPPSAKHFEEIEEPKDLLPDDEREAKVKETMEKLKGMF